MNYKFLSLRIFKVKVLLVTEYMQHRMDDNKLADWLQLRGKIIENQGITDDAEKTATYHSYFDENGFYIPSEHFQQCFCNGGKTVKGKVGAQTKSMTQVVSGQFFILEEKIRIPKFDQIDIRSAVNGNVKARVMVTRPKWSDGLEVEFHLGIDDVGSEITEKTIFEIMKNGGSFSGIGSYRPEHKGQFGRFIVQELTYLKTKQIGEEI